jgi:hypothetical protein
MPQFNSNQHKAIKSLALNDQQNLNIGNKGTGIHWDEERDISDDEYEDWETAADREQEEEDQKKKEAKHKEALLKEARENLQVQEKEKVMDASAVVGKLNWKTYEKPQEAWFPSDPVLDMTNQKKEEQPAVVRPVWGNITKKPNGSETFSVGTSYSEIKKMNKKQLPAMDLTKTQMCKFANRCTSKTCTYAHKLDELKMMKCAFSNCNRVIKSKTGEFYNTKSGKVCKGQHHGETRDNCLKRNGMITPVIILPTFSKLGLEKSKSTTKPTTKPTPKPVRPPSSTYTGNWSSFGSPQPAQAQSLYPQVPPQPRPTRWGPPNPPPQPRPTRWGPPNPQPLYPPYPPPLYTPYPPKPPPVAAPRQSRPIPTPRRPIPAQRKNMFSMLEVN